MRSPLPWWQTPRMALALVRAHLEVAAAFIGAADDSNERAREILAGVRS